MSGGGGWSPFLCSSSADIEENDRYRQREMTCSSARGRPGRGRRRELGNMVGASTGARGGFSRALKVAVRHGRLGHPRRGYYGLGALTRSPGRRAAL